MRRSITLTLTVLITAAALAQSLITSSNNKYVGGDRLTVQQVKSYLTKESTKDGSASWNINKMEAQKKYVVNYIIQNDSFPNRLTGFEAGTRYNYEMKDNAVFIVGYRNRLTRMDFDEPEEYLHLPMALGDSVMGYYHGRGIYGDKLALRNYGWYKTKAEKIGKLVLPDGKTLHRVLQVHTERLVSSHFYPIVRLDSLKAFSEDSVRLYLSRDSTIYKAVIDRWYAPGYRYPVLETRATKDYAQDRPLLSQTLYFPPSEQEMQLQCDTINEKVRKHLSDDHTIPASKSKEFHFEASYDGERREIAVHYQTGHELRMSYALCSIDAIVIYQHPEQVIYPGAYSDLINVSTVKPGIYALVIYIDGQHYASEKIAVN